MSISSSHPGRDCLIGRSLIARYSSSVRAALDALPENFVITDPCISGNPIVFASRGFIDLCGYTVGEVIGRNGRMFQGPGTDRRSVLEIREAIRGERGVQISLLNYRKDGSPYRILLQLSPVFGVDDGSVVHFVGVQVPISRKSRAFGSSMRDVVLGSCGMEMCVDSMGELGRCPQFDSFVDSDNRGLEAEESCEASELEKQKASTAINNILSALIHYSELTGSVVCRKRCSSFAVGSLSSSLNTSLGRIKQSFVLTDPHLPDMPIVYASDAFLHSTGYSRQEVIGHNCRFLNGPGTDVEALCQIRKSIQTEQACTVRILNYRKDKSSFWNLLHISPVRDASGKVVFYIRVQLDEGSKNEGQGLNAQMRLLGAVGAVKVAVRSLSMGPGPSKP
uniref:Putative LOV domain-containing protein n=1 Tax=Sarcandra glabra TaxID=92927 RepID=A0A126X0B0_9MAGN|nr:putative LOV domain-containing protein [Sarcandra glabra]